MAKVWTFVMISVAVTLLLSMVGISTGAEWILDFLHLSIDQDPSTSSFFIAVIAMISLAVGAGVAAMTAGFFVRAAPEYTFLGGFATATLVLFLGTFYQLSQTLRNYDTMFSYPIFFLFGLFTIGFILSLADWVFGRD